jgi:hypothetical protein
MKKINVTAVVCLVVGFAVFMATDSSIAANSFLGNDTIIFGSGNGPGDGTGNDGNGPSDGTGNGPGDCSNLISDLHTDGLLLSGNGNGGNGNGPGDGSGNGGNGPSDGTGNGPGDC